MKINQKIAFAAVAVLSTSVLAACGEAPDEKDPAAGGSGGAKSDFNACIVSDAGGFDDKSFNQLSFEGLEEGAKEVGAKVTKAQSTSDSDYAPNLATMVSNKCGLIVSVGFNLSGATVDAAKKSPDTHFAIVDDMGDTDFDGKTDAPNIKPLLYDTAQAAFLAGYAAADYTKTGTVGTYGGMEIPTVTIFMDGFKQGVDYYNKTKNKNVKVVGWNGKTGTFTGGFDANEKATSAARTVLDGGADVVLPVGGPIYQGLLTAIEDSGKDVAMVGVDADQFETDAKTQKYILTSIEKRMDASTKDVVVAAAGGTFDATPYVGTLENGGVDIAPFHNFESKVSDTLQGELDQLKTDIISGKVEVTSYLK